MTKCSRCTSRITTHLWVVDGRAYCGPSCQRGGKSMFEGLKKALGKMYNTG